MENNWEQRLYNKYERYFGAAHMSEWSQLISDISQELEKAREEVKKVFQEEEAFILAQAREEGRQEGRLEMASNNKSEDIAPIINKAGRRSLEISPDLLDENNKWWEKEVNKLELSIRQEEKQGL